MRLQKLILSNFQGIRQLSLNFNGENTSVYGNNGTGKTTIFNAVTWILFDKSSTGAKSYTPKTYDAKGNGIHYLEHSAEAVFHTETGQILSLKKTFKEEYTKKRGSATEEFTGHKNYYYINGIPSQEKEYQATVLKYFTDTEKMKILMLPRYFASEIKWEDCRKMLLSMCDDVSDVQVIKSKKELIPLLETLVIPGAENDLYTVDEYRKIASAQIKDINRELNVIPSRIDEAEQANPDIDGLVLSDIDDALKVMLFKIAEREAEKQQIEQGDNAVNIIREQISSLQVELSEAKAEHVAAASKVNDDT